MRAQNVHNRKQGGENVKHTAIKVIDEIHGSDKVEIEINVLIENAEEEMTKEILNEIKMFEKKLKRIVGGKSAEPDERNGANS